MTTPTSSTPTERPEPRHQHEWGYVELVTETVQREVYHPSPVGGLCIHCQKLRADKNRKRKVIRG